MALATFVARAKQNYITSYRSGLSAASKTLPYKPRFKSTSTSTWSTLTKTCPADLALATFVAEQNQSNNTSYDLVTRSRSRRRLLRRTTTTTAPTYDLVTRCSLTTTSPSTDNNKDNNRSREALTIPLGIVELTQHNVTHNITRSLNIMLVARRSRPTVTHHVIHDAVRHLRCL